MIEKGFRLNAAGFWIASKMPDHLKLREREDVDNGTVTQES
jgi:hypothetical protein